MLTTKSQVKDGYEGRHHEVVPVIDIDPSSGTMVFPALRSSTGCPSK